MKQMKDKGLKFKNAFGFLLISIATMMMVYLKFTNLGASDFGLVFLYSEELLEAVGVMFGGIFCFALN